jgi:hypothetical protein
MKMKVLSLHFHYLYIFNIPSSAKKPRSVIKLHNLTIEALALSWQAGCTTA